MIALYIITGIIAFFAILLSFNASVRVIFNSSAKEDMQVYAKIGFYKINIIPLKQKKEKKIRKKRIRKRKPKTEKIVKEKEEKKEPVNILKKYTIPELFNFVIDIGMLLLKRVKKHFKVKIYKINVALASDEAEKTAMMYGAANQSAAYLFEFLNHNFKVKKKPDSINIIPDFSKIQTSFEIDIKFYIRLSHAAALGIASAMKFVKFWFKPGKKEKVEKTEKVKT